MSDKVLINLATVGKLFEQFSLRAAASSWPVQSA